MDSISRTLTTMYKQYLDMFSKIADGIIRLADHACIPFDPANTDAHEFALWLKAGNVPEPADAEHPVTQEWIDETIKKLLPETANV